MYHHSEQKYRMLKKSMRSIGINMAFKRNIRLHQRFHKSNTVHNRNNSICPCCKYKTGTGIFYLHREIVSGAVAQQPFTSEPVTGYPKIAAFGRFFDIVAAAAAKCPPAENPITAIYPKIFSILLLSCGSFPLPVHNPAGHSATQNVSQPNI